jgi:RING-variant domain/FHA domain
MLNSDKVISVPKNARHELTSETKFLSSITKTNQNFIVDVNKKAFKDKGYSYEDSWLALKKVKSTNGYAISEGDIIRLGKVQLKIKEIKGVRSPKVAKTMIQSKKIYSGGIGSALRAKVEAEKPLTVRKLETEREQFACRICLNDENTEENPLITPCNCAGSMGWIHLECLQKWLNSKVASRDYNNATCYSWKSLECELCKFKYPDRIKVEENIYNLLSVTKPDNFFIVLESVNNTANSNKTINVIPFQDKKNIRLGRGHDSDIRLADISVSRNHANIKLTSGGLFLDDVSSKFGTLVKIKKPIVVNIGSKVSIQCGRTLMTIGLKKPFSFFSCLGSCNRNRDSDEDIVRPREATDESMSQNFDHSN